MTGYQSQDILLRNPTKQYSHSAYLEAIDTHFQNLVTKLSYFSTEARCSHIAVVSNDRTISIWTDTVLYNYLTTVKLENYLICFAQKSGELQHKSDDAETNIS